MFADPSRDRRSDISFFGVEIRRPGNDPVGAHQLCSQTQAPLRVASEVIDGIAPGISKRSQERVSFEIEQQASPGLEVLVQPLPVDQFEVRRASSHQRMAVTEVIAEATPKKRSAK